MSRKKAFTLVELLVCLTIITTLIGLLMPYLSHARHNAKQVVCMSNLHQIGLITQMYVQDHQGEFPELFFDFNPGNSGTIVVLVVPKKAAVTGWRAYHPNKVLQCPGDEYPSEVPVRDDLNNVTWEKTSYGFNIEVDVFNIKHQEIKVPTRLAIWYDGRMGRSTDSEDTGKIQGHFFGTDDYVSKTYRARHPVRPDTGNVLFADWHVEARQNIPTDLVVLNQNFVHNPNGNGNGNGGGSGSGGGSGGGGSGGGGSGGGGSGGKGGGKTK